MYELSDKGIDLIVAFEGLKLVPYNDANGWATVGIGHLIAKRPVDLNIDQVITKQQAYDLFRKDASVEVIIINRRITSMTQGQFDAMVSLAYNIGIGRFENDTLIISLMNSNQSSLVPAEFMKHIYDAKGVALPGLVRRRNAELVLFNS